MSRISSQGSQIMISDVNATPTFVGIASATKAKPCVITLATGTAPVVGDIIVPRGTGWSSLDGRPYKVKTVAAQVITLEDSDTTVETGTIRTSTDSPPAQIEKQVWLELCRSNFNLNQPAGAVIDVTTLCDDAHHIIAGLPAVGTWTAAGFYDMDDAAMFAARDALRTGEMAFFDVRFRDGGGVTYAGTVNTFDLTMGVNAAVANNIGGNVDGLVSFYRTPAPGFVVHATMVRTVGGPSAAQPQESVRERVAA